MKRYRVLFAAVLVLTTLLATSVSAEKKVVTYWSWSPVKQTTDKMVAAFEAEYPDITIKATIYNYPDYLLALKTAAASDSLPDLIGLEPGAMTQEYRDYLVPLQDAAVEMWGEDWQDQFYPIGLDQARLGNPAGDENFYMLPMELQTTNLWYNRQLFDKLGLEVPTTWDEFKEVAAALRKAGIAPLVQGGADGWQNIDVFMMIAQQTAPGVIYKAEDGEAPFNHPGLVEAMRYWQELFTEGIVQPGAMGMSVYPNAASLFNAGRGGMISLGSWHMQTAKSEPPVPLSQGMLGVGAFLFPDVDGDGQPTYPPLGGIDFGIGMTKKALGKPEVLAVLDSFITGSGIQAAIDDFNDLPAVKGIEPNTFTTDHERELWAMFVDDWLPKVTAPRQLKSPEVRQGLMDALAAVATGQKTPEKALDDLQNAVGK
ncbi:MAG: extracellular solute-binding protein [Firmicutes bacterium]|nr:extracellular solute-binding protein [Bacillota bacterium]